MDLLAVKKRSCFLFAVSDVPPVRTRLFFYRFVLAIICCCLSTGRAHCEPPRTAPAKPAQAKTPALIPAPAPSVEKSKAHVAGLSSPEGILGYSLGLSIGNRIIADFKAQGVILDPAGLACGLADAILGTKPQIKESTMTESLQAFERVMKDKAKEQEKMFAIQSADAAKRNIVTAKKFLTDNSKKPGVTNLPSGLQYEVLKHGTGAKPLSSDTVSTRYRGTHLNGTQFDGTEPNGEPAIFPIEGVVLAWQEAIPLMAVGSQWKLYVPPDLAYGVRGSPPDIEPNEMLIFEIELVAIVPAPVTDR